MDRRIFLARSLAAASLSLPPSVARALGIDADTRSGTIQDVVHVVIFMQENRAFDHYFGAMGGVRGFGDRFPIPVSEDGAGGYRTVWNQDNGAAGPLLPFHLDTLSEFGLMRVADAPHTWPDTQEAWDQGRMSRWPQSKTPRSMGHFLEADIPFQHALAAGFTLCDSYHCSIQAGTNPNRLFLWTGTNDGLGQGGGPAIGNSHDRFVADGGSPASYRWTSYAERLQAAGIDWRIYEDMADNYTDNPLAGFKSFRDAHAGLDGSDPELLARGLSTQALDRFRSDVLADRLPQVSYIISSAAASEHPDASSPAQGADYTAQVLDALTARPDVWARTALFLMFDENDGFFDHVPPPAPPSRDPAAPDGLAGASTAGTEGEYHLIANVGDEGFERPELMGRPYGLGPRVPMYVISPWSRGGWVNSELFDHTSVIRFLENRFGVMEPNISPWRRAVCGDLTSAFDFKRPNDARLARLPATAALSARAASLQHMVPPLPAAASPPVQAHGVRPSRALPYRLAVDCTVHSGAAQLRFRNNGSAAAVFHVYDRRHLDRVPRRYTIEANKEIEGIWETQDDGGAYDLWILGPNGLHRHFAGNTGNGECEVSAREDNGKPSLTLVLRNPGSVSRELKVTPLAYEKALPPWQTVLGPEQSATHRWMLAATGGWYDLAVSSPAAPGFLRRFAGRVETGRDSISDPAMGGPAILRQS